MALVMARARAKLRDEQTTRRRAVGLVVESLGEHLRQTSRWSRRELGVNGSDPFSVRSDDGRLAIRRLGLSFSMTRALDPAARLRKRVSI
jgi:hypothetical protein